MSQLAPPAGFLPQLVVDLNQNPPTLSEYLSDPPVYAPNGGTFYNGSIIWGASGGNDSIGGGEQRVSIRTLDPATNRTTTLINNYYGYYFNTIDDLCVHSRTGDIFFTDPRTSASCSASGRQAADWPFLEYSWFNALTDTPPQLPSASYRYSQKTGAVFLVDDTLQQPNGIALHPNLTTLYISDTGEYRKNQSIQMKMISQRFRIRCRSRGCAIGPPGDTIQCISWTSVGAGRSLTCNERDDAHISHVEPSMLTISTKRAPKSPTSVPFTWPLLMFPTG